MSISIIVPCYNEEASIPLFYQEATRVLQTMDTPYEILFVNDGSSDQTLPVIRQLAQRDPHITYLSFSRNFGKESALLAGLCNMNGDYVAVMDADLQDSPEEIPALRRMILEEGYDLVSGWKKKRHDPIGKRWPSKFFNWTARAAQTGKANLRYAAGLPTCSIRSST